MPDSNRDLSRINWNVLPITPHAQNNNPIVPRIMQRFLFHLGNRVIHAIWSIRYQLKLEY